MKNLIGFLNLWNQIPSAAQGFKQQCGNVLLTDHYLISIFSPVFIEWTSPSYSFPFSRKLGNVQLTITKAKQQQQQQQHPPLLVVVVVVVNC